jgi:hypothetical protein
MPGARAQSGHYDRGLGHRAYRFEVLAGAGYWLPERHARNWGHLLLEHLRRWDTWPVDAGGPAPLTLTR